jgi:hypothetical protein
MVLRFNPDNECFEALMLQPTVLNNKTISLKDGYVGIKPTDKI